MHECASRRGYRRPAMNRICAKPGCHRHAVATLAYSYGDGVVWVEDLAEVAHPMLHDLCGDHASQLRVPRGWECRDSRSIATLTAGGQRKTA
jgi:hypothetical protein